MVIFLIIIVIEKKVYEQGGSTSRVLRTQNVMTFSQAYFFPNKKENLGLFVQLFWHQLLL